MPRAALVLILLTAACVGSTSVTRTGNLLPVRQQTTEEEEPPRGLTLSVGSIAADGTVLLDLRNYSIEPFVFSGTKERARLVVEVHSGDSQSRYTLLPTRWGRTHEVPAGERLQLKMKLGDASGRVRIGIRSQDYGYMVWTDWFIP